jgi:hypothetical protein
MNGIEIETLMNTKKCWYCGNNKPAIGNQRKNGKSFQNYSNGNNDWKNESVRKYCKKCFKTVKEMETRCYFDTYNCESGSEEEMKQIKENKERHKKYLDFKMNKVQEQIDERNQKKLSKKTKSKKTN